jgi:hypothetical protein
MNSPRKAILLMIITSVFFVILAALLVREGRAGALSPRGSGIILLGLFIATLFGAVFLFRGKKRSG